MTGAVPSAVHSGQSSPQRIALLGHGAMGRQLLQRLCDAPLPDTLLAVLARHASVPAPALPGVQLFSTLDALLQWQPSLVVECSGHEAVASLVPPLLAQGVDVVLASIGALANPGLRATLLAASREGQAQLGYVAGAIGGLDALSAARQAGLTRVAYIGRKPPLAWLGSVAQQQVDLHDLRQPVTLFKGAAAEAACLYPKNANVAAAIALAGIGFDATEIELVADPAIDCNVHEIDACGAFGRMVLRLENNPLPDNPKTSWLAALSLEDAIRRRCFNPVFICPPLKEISHESLA